MSKLTDNLKKDFKSGYLNKTDLIVIFGHLTIGLLIWCTHQYNLIDKKNLKEFSNIYIFLTPFLLVGLFFRKLRKIRFWSIWLTISIIQLFIYPLVKNNPDFDFPRGTAFDSLVSLFPTLIIYQILRLIYYSIKEEEMIISLRQYRWTMFEKEDRRNMNWLDIAFSIILGLTSILSGILLTS